MKIVLVTGGFDPVHSGHIKYLEAAYQLGDRLFVGLNSDEWLRRKKGRAFMPWEERAAVLKSMSCVGDVLQFDDSDDSACSLLEELKKSYSYAEIIFANGGDRTAANIPEMKVKDVLFKFGIGGENKSNSSSLILDAWKTQKTERPWGYWRILEEQQGYKVKELVIRPGYSLSNQRHLNRSEHWYILKGSCTILTEYNGITNIAHKNTNETYLIGQKVWHQCKNESTDECHILEIQFGSQCIEEDIERK